MRIRLRRPRADDAEAIFRVMQDAAMTRWLPGLPQPYPRADAVAFLAAASDGPDRAIEVDGVFAGMIRTGADLGYWLAPAFQGRGIMRRAAQVALMAHFSGSDAPVHAQVLTDNDVSRRLLVDLGFRDVGPATIPRQADGADLPGRDMALHPDAFAASLRIITPRCRIMPLQEADLPELHRIITLPQVARMLLRFYPGQSFDEVAALIRPAMDPRTRPMRMAVRLEGRLIGSIGLHAGDLPPIYYFLAPEVAGHGLASEIVPLFCDSVQDWYRLDSLSAEVFGDNPASRRVLEKAGFRVVEQRMLSSAARAEPAGGFVLRRD